MGHTRKEEKSMCYCVSRVRYRMSRVEDDLELKEEK